MTEPLIIAVAVLSAINLGLLVLILFRRPKVDAADVRSQFEALEKALERSERLLAQEIARNREETLAITGENRRELINSLQSFNDSVLARMADLSSLQKSELELFSNQLAKMTQTIEVKLEQLRETVEKQLQYLREDNAQKLEQMRLTVDEKLHSTLEQRLGESFLLVSKRLEEVHKGLGEMQALAAGVGDLKKVLTNVKTRGTWGEIQLGNLLEQVLSPDQYATNVAIRPGSQDRVEFAIKLPARNGQDGITWLPIDAKFPLEDYHNLLDAQERADLPAIERYSKALEQRIKNEAKAICTKYIDPPNTTDFAILFLPVEGLYAEVLRRPGLCEELQRNYRVVISGPTTIAAFLNSLQMGFRTLAIEKRSSDVWNLLGAVKTEFGKFGDLLEKTQKKLQEASNSIETAARKSRTIERKLKSVEELPQLEAAKYLDQFLEAEDDVS